MLSSNKWDQRKIYKDCLIFWFSSHFSKTIKKKVIIYKFCFFFCRLLLLKIKKKKAELFPIIFMKIHIILFDFGKKNIEGKPGPGRREKNTRELKQRREQRK